MPEERRLDAESMKALAEFLPKFEAPEFRFGRWESEWFSLSQDGHGFVSTCYETGWVQLGFDWPKWIGTREAARLRDDPAGIENASPEQLRRLLTALIRQDRFVEGLLGGAFESGLLLRIVRRVAELVGGIPDE